MNISQKILLQRKKKGISQEDLANALNVSRQAVSKWESSQSVPDMDKIVALSNYVKFSIFRWIIFNFCCYLYGRNGLTNICNEFM